MIDMADVYQRAREVLSEEEVQALLQDRHMLAVIIVNEFAGDYVLSAYDIQSLYERRAITLTSLVLDSGEVVLKAEYVDEE